MKKKTQDYQIVSNMKSFGDKFCKALANTIYHADEKNLLKLKQAFPEYFNEYKKLCYVLMRELGKKKKK